MIKGKPPNIACSGRRWRGLGAGRDLVAWWHPTARADLWMSPATPLTLAVGPLMPSLLRNANQVLTNEIRSVYYCYQSYGYKGTRNGIAIAAYGIHSLLEIYL